MRKPSSVKANKNERMIEIKLRFWTNKIGKGEGYVIPKQAWSSGMVRIERNETHGIRPGSPKPFHSLLDIGAVIERVLTAQGITLHRNKKMKKYVS